MTAERAADVVVVGSGAGGGVVAARLAEIGRKVVLLEEGPHRTARDFVRFEAASSRDLYAPVRFASTGTDGGPSVAMVRGRCVGGSTTINGSVALRPSVEDFDKWHAASAPLDDEGGPLTLEGLAPWYERVEERMGVRLRDDWAPSIRMLQLGFEAVGAQLVPLGAYTDHNCFGCGACLQGCPTNAGKSTLVGYIHPALATQNLELRPGCRATRVLIERARGRTRATGVELVDEEGRTGTLSADVVVVAAGTLDTPLLLLRSGLGDATGSVSGRLIGGNLGIHLGRHVYGVFDTPQDLHMAFATTAGCFNYIADSDGGFLVYASVMMDPIGLATNLVDADFQPLWGSALEDVMSAYRRLAGVYVMVNDENTGSAELDADGQERFTFPISHADSTRMADGMAVAEAVLRAAGARAIHATGYLTAHVQGTCRMGSDPARSVVDSHGESHEVEALFVADGSVLPRTLSIGPSLTIMALAERTAEHIDRDPRRYLSAPAAVSAAG